ncbi:uncharacterized protein ACNLHF_010553 [Anomaloglossus baeobatrachus]|uniref:uncharacterized protein LOC142291251 n=1 Tax=Anomaloglossus baeobatrachus TaxID=238106 RepID=UPI003F4FFAA6
MKKNSSMQGTLNKIFGKKNSNNNSLYANNPPWMLPQGAKKASVDYSDEIHNSFAFLDDSGTATLKSRPGPRVRPTLQFSTSNTDAQGLAVPTPSVPLGFSDNVSIGNGSKMNGNYRMYSSVGDLRLINYYNDYPDEIPAPPSMPPPPPPSMAPPPPPQRSPPSSTISSPSSPSPPDFIPPTPHASAPSFLPTDQSAVPTIEQQQSNNVAKWKSETGLNAGLKDQPMTLPNRFSLNPAAFQHNQGQTNFDVEPRSTLPKSFKIPPPAPTRTSSMQLQEPQNISYSNVPPRSPVPSSFNPSVQAKLYASNQAQLSLNDTLNKRKSMLIMEDLPGLSENNDQITDKSTNVTDSVANATSIKDNTNILHNPHVDYNRQIKKEDTLHDIKIESSSIIQEDHPKLPYKPNIIDSALTSVPANGVEGQNYFQTSTGYNTLTHNKHGFTQEIQKTSKPTVKHISIKPIIDDLTIANSNGFKFNSLTRKEMDIFPQELTRMDIDIKSKPGGSLGNVKESPPTPPPMAPPPPPPPPPPPLPPMAVPLPTGNITPPKNSFTINSKSTPPTPPPVVRMPSPLLSPKPKTISIAPKPPSLVSSQPPKAPPVPPPLPSSLGPSGSAPLLEALQTKQQSLKKISQSIEVRPAQTSSITSMDDDQKVRVGKIKGELEALFSPKKDEKGERLKNSRIGLEANKNSNGNVPQSKGGENTLVNSLMLKVPLLPAKFERDDADTDNSEWLPKGKKMDIQIPEPDYLPTSPIYKTEKSTYSESQNKIPKATLEKSFPSSPIDSPPKDSNIADTLKSSIPTYKPHRGSKVPSESSTLDEIPVVMSKPAAEVSVNLDRASHLTDIVSLAPSVEQESLKAQAENTSKYPVAQEQFESNSPMALLMAAQKRAQKTKSTDKKNLPKISVTSGIVSSSTSPYVERKTNTLVSNKNNAQQFDEEEVTSFTSSSFQNSTLKDREPQFSDISSTFDRTLENSNDQFSVPYDYNSANRMVSTINGPEEYWKPKSTTFDNYVSTAVPKSIESPPSFNIAAFPSPVHNSKMEHEIEYGIIPPPAEFMNSPVASNSNLLSMQQEGRPYHFDHSTSFQADLIPNYDRNDSILQPSFSRSTSSNHDLNSYSSDHYSTAQRGSLIKRRLYMPEPESSTNYGLNTSSLRSSTVPMSYSNLHTQTSSSMGPDPRRSNSTSRFLPPGRRVSSENIGRIGQTMTEMKYMPQNSDYSVGKSSTRSQSKFQQGMTFTVRPGTRQPISQMYQGGYL